MCLNARPSLARCRALACTMGACIWLGVLRAAHAPPSSSPAAEATGGARASDAPPPAAGPLEKVRVTYLASPACPGEEVFLSAVRARIGTEWDASPGKLARTISVTVGVDA